MARPPESPTSAEPEARTAAGGKASATGAGSTPGQPTPAAAAALGTLSDLPVAGLTRRRIALLLGALVAAWVIVLFARQVGEASEASTRADAMRVVNDRLAGTVTALERELQLIQRQAYIEQQAREYRLGGAREVPFILEDDAVPIADDAPGTAASRLGAALGDETPLDSWLSLLFGPPGNPVNPMGEPIPSDPPTPPPSG